MTQKLSIPLLDKISHPYMMKPEALTDRDNSRNPPEVHELHLHLPRYLKPETSERNRVKGQGRANSLDLRPRTVSKFNMGEPMVRSTVKLNPL